MKQFRILFITFATGAVIFGSCSTGKQKDGTQTGSVVEVEEAVKVMELQLQTVSRTVEYPATLMAYEEVHLAPASPGRIEAIYADVGDRISSGTPLVQMDRTQLHQAEVQLKSLEADFRRLDTLASYGSVAQQQFDQLRTQYEIAKSNVEFLRENTRLVAPFNGVISGRYFEPGEMFSGAPNTPVGKAAVLSFVQTDRLKALVKISERFFPYVKTGMEVVVNVDVYPTEQFAGRISRIYPIIDPVTRSFTVEFTIRNTSALLRPGMFARASLDLEQVEVFVAPALAVLKLQGSNQRYVFLEKNGRAQRVVVELGDRFDDKIEIVSDKIAVGDNLVIAGQARLVDGVALKTER